MQTVFNRDEGDAPSVDLDTEKRTGDFIRQNCTLIKACRDLSDGGLALVAFEMAHEGGVGIQLTSDDTEFLFGEDQARYLVACNFDQAEALMVAAFDAGITISSVGRFTGNDVKFGKSQAPLTELSHIFTSQFGKTFN